MGTADESVNARELDEAIAAAMTKLRNASPPLEPEALEVVDRIDAEIAQRRSQDIVNGLTRWLDDHPDVQDAPDS